MGKVGFGGEAEGVELGFVVRLRFLWAKGVVARGFLLKELSLKKIRR